MYTHLKILLLLILCNSCQHVQVAEADYPKSIKLIHSKVPNQRIKGKARKIAVFKRRVLGNDYQSLIFWLMKDAEAKGANILACDFRSYVEENGNFVYAVAFQIDKEDFDKLNSITDKNFFSGDREIKMVFTSMHQNIADKCLMLGKVETGKLVDLLVTSKYNCIRSLKIEASILGSNVIVSNLKVLDKKISGLAYSCPQDVFSKLVNSEELVEYKTTPIYYSSPDIRNYDDPLVRKQDFDSNNYIKGSRFY